MSPSDDARRPEVEAALERTFPGQWRFEPAVPLEYFDLDGSRAARVRLDVRLTDEAVDLYEGEMRRGAQFPPIITTGDMQAKGLFIIDGLMIYQAAVRANRLRHPAYVVAGDVERVAAHLFFNTSPFPTEPGVHPLERHLGPRPTQPPHK